MAFQTIPASGSAPVQFIGTDGPDAIDIRATSTFILTGEGGDDSVVLSGQQIFNSAISLGDGADIFTGNILGGGTIVQTRINGNAGDDTFGSIARGISATNSNPNAVVPSTGQGAGILGGQGDDTIYISNLQSSRVNGNMGDDTIFAGIGGGAAVAISDSEIFGGQGNDLINVVNTGVTNAYVNTLISGNDGDDSISVAVTGTTQFINSTIAGGLGNDTINASASTVSLLIETGEGNDSVLGGNGDDSINGGSGQDTLTGAIGNDTISGGDGNDVIIGGAGADRLSGGTGANRFVQRAGSTSSPINLAEGGLPDSIISGGDTAFFGAGADGPDIITDWQLGAGTNVLDTGFLGLVVDGVTPAQAMSYGVAYASLVDGDNVAVRGNYRVNADGSSQFEVGSLVAGLSTGADILVFTFEGGTSTNATVLLDAGTAQLSAADFVVV